MADKLAYLKRHKWMYFLMLPGIIYFIIFKYVPMGGLIIAFQNYSPYLELREANGLVLSILKTSL